MNQLQVLLICVIVTFIIIGVLYYITKSFSESFMIIAMAALGVTVVGGIYMTVLGISPNYVVSNEVPMVVFISLVTFIITFILSGITSSTDYP